MKSAVTLIGLDFGTTTSSGVVARARVIESAPGGHIELGDLEERCRSPILLTPYGPDGSIDPDRALALADEWLALAGVSAGEIFGGGALITGLAARGEGAKRLAERIRDRIGRALIASAEDPCLESWMAFMGSAADLSREHPQTPMVNIDIGGGTTNVAIGLGGEVLRTGCLLIGARHVKLVPGTYEIEKLSPEAADLFSCLDIPKRPGDTLDPAEVDRIVDIWARLLEAFVRGEGEPFQGNPAKFADLPEVAGCARYAETIVQAPLDVPRLSARPVILFSGGVGELIYAAARGEALPPPTHYGDLGVDLARRILRSPSLAADADKYALGGGGRALVYGLLRHSTVVSGATLFLPRPELLPLRDLPILASISPASSDADIAAAIDLLQRSGRGGSIEVTLESAELPGVRSMGRRIGAALDSARFPDDLPLVILTSQNVGKALGGYITGFGERPRAVVVLDELRRPGARFVHLGDLRDQVVPVSFYGMG
jgi:ethanolamine utilization protein EutA